MLLRRAAAVTPRILIAAALLAGTAAAQSITPLGTGPWNRPEKRTLAAGESFAFEVALRAGLDYAIHGECSADCDLVVLDPDGAVVGEDTEVDAIPSVNVTAERSGRFGVEVSCPSAECDALVRTEQMTEQILNGELGEDDEASFPVRLMAGMKYRFSGVCDMDCGDLDLLVQHPGGKPLPRTYCRTTFR